LLTFFLEQTGWVGGIDTRKRFKIKTTEAKSKTRKGRKSEEL